MSEQEQTEEEEEKQRSNNDENDYDTTTITVEPDADIVDTDDTFFSKASPPELPYTLDGEKCLVDRFLGQNIWRKQSVVDNEGNSRLLGYYYQFLHVAIIVLSALCLLFVHDVSYLVALLIVITLDGISQTFFHDCPLTILEKKYLKTSMAENHKNSIRKLGVLYNCNHLYESQMEVVINGWSLVAIKILCLVLHRSGYVPLRPV